MLYVTSLHLSTSAFALSTKKNVLVPSACPGITCASLPSSFEYYLSYNLRHLGFFITCWYFIRSHVSSFNTALIILSGNLRPASFCGDMVSCMTSAHADMDSWAMEKVLLLVLHSGLSSCIIYSSHFLASSTSRADRWGGFTLGGVTGRSDQNNSCGLENLRGTDKPHPKLLAGTTSLCVLCNDYTIGSGGDRFSVLVGTLEGAVEGTDSAIFCCLSSSSILLLRMLPRVVMF